MDARTACPTAEALQQLLLGLGDPACVQDLEQHLTHCPLCAEQAGRLAAEDEVVRAVRRVAGDAEPVPEVVEALRIVFRGLRPVSAAPVSPLSTQDVPTTGFDVPHAPAADLDHLGPYELRGLLGAGGMGRVYRGYDSRLRRPVAVKVVQSELLALAGMAERFLEEARAAARIEHDNIVVVYAVEVYDGIPCITMPLLQGQTLEQRLNATPGPLPVDEVLRLAREVVAGLRAAHAAGLIHRDVKPANIWLEAPTGRAKLLDFGLALMGEAREHGTGFAGTPGYMAPEQVRGEGIDARADLFALGCVLYRAATGTAAFAADTPAGTLVRAVTRPPLPATTVNPKLLPQLGRLIDRLVARRPEDRPASAQAVADELDALATSRANAAARRSRRRWLAGLVAAGLLGAAGVWWVLADAPPVRVEVRADPEVTRVFFLRDGREEALDLSRDLALSLAPGEYRLRAEPNLPGRELVPGTLTVTAGQPRTVALALVGEVERSTAHTQEVTGVAIVPGKERFSVLSCGLDRTVQAWTPGTKEPARLVTLASPARCFAATPDGTRAVTAGGNKQAPVALGIQVWDGPTLTPLGKVLEGHGRLIAAVAIAPDGKRLLSAAADEVRLWDVARGTHRLLVGHAAGAKVLTAAFDATGQRMLTGDSAGAVLLWNTADGTVVQKLVAQAPGDGNAVRAVAFVGAGFVTTGDDGVLRVWDGPPFTAREIAASSRAVLALAVAPDGKRVLTGDAAGAVKLWSLSAGVQVGALAGHAGAVHALAFTPDGRGAVSGGADRTVRLWRLPFE